MSVVKVIDKVVTTADGKELFLKIVQHGDKRGWMTKQLIEYFGSSAASISQAAKKAKAWGSIIDRTHLQPLKDANVVDINTTHMKFYNETEVGEIAYHLKTDRAKEMLVYGFGVGVRAAQALAEGSAAALDNVRMDIGLPPLYPGLPDDALAEVHQLPVAVAPVLKLVPPEPTTTVDEDLAFVKRRWPDLFDKIKREVAAEVFNEQSEMVTKAVEARVAEIAANPVPFVLENMECSYQMREKCPYLHWAATRDLFNKLQRNMYYDIGVTGHMTMLVERRLVMSRPLGEYLPDHPVQPYRALFPKGTFEKAERILEKEFKRQHPNSPGPDREREIAEKSIAKLNKKLLTI